VELDKRLAQRGPLVDQLRALQREIDLEEKEYRSSRDEKLDELLISRGRLEGEIASLENQIRSAEQLDILRRELQELKAQIEELNQRIRTKEERQRSNLRTAYEKIESIAKEILQRDL